jgi:hypothetical protein
MLGISLLDRRRRYGGEKEGKVRRNLEYVGKRIRMESSKNFVLD